MSQKKIPLFFMGLLSAFSLITFDLYQPSLPYITDYFNSTAGVGQLTLSIYLLTFGVSQCLCGPLIDYYGRRKLLSIGLLVAIIASLLCAYASSMELLIIGRALQGVGLCCTHLIAFSLSGDIEDEAKRANVLSYINMIVAASPILAPGLGALLFIYWGWRINFILMATLGFILLIQTKESLRESPFWTLKNESYSWKTLLTEYKSLLSSSSLWSGSLIMTCSFAAAMLTVLNASYLIMDRMHYSALSFGILFMFNGINIIVGNYVGIGLRKYFSMGATIYWGNAFICLGGLGMYLMLNQGGLSLWTLSFALLSNWGISICAPPTMSLMLSDYTTNTGKALAFIHTLRLVGSSLLSALVGYALTQNLYALPWGLLVCGLIGQGAAWHFTYKDSSKIPLAA